MINTPPNGSSPQSAPANCEATAAPVDPPAGEVKPAKKLTRATKRKMRAFLKAYAECGSVVQSAKVAKMNRTNHYRWLHEFLDYAGAFDLAEEMAVGVLEDEARFRAIVGLRKYKFNGKGQPIYIRCNSDHPESIGFGEDENGKPVYMRHYYEDQRSDTLLLAGLNASLPDKYGRYNHQHSGKIDHEHTGKVVVYLPQNYRRSATPATAERRNLNGNTNGNGTQN